MGPATIENTKLELDVNGEPFVASGDVLVTPGFREAIRTALSAMSRCRRWSRAIRRRVRH